MRGGHEQQPQIAWETVVNDVKKLVIWLDLGLLYSCPFSHPLIFQRLSPFISLHRYVEVSRYQTLSIFSDVISDQMSLVAARMTSFSSFLSCLPLSKWNSCKSLETVLFNITTSDFPSLWQNVMYPLKQSFRFLLIWVGP